MLNKKILILTLILVSLFTISSVSASEIDMDSSDLSIDDSMSGVNVDESEVESVPDGTFADLANEIDNASYELNLTRNYAFSQGDDDYQLGIDIYKQITINGNGFIINGNNQARAFEVNSDLVTLNNIYFVNCSADTNGGAISWYGDDGTLIDCSFANCSAGIDGGAVWMCDVFNGTVYSCNFVNCTADVSGEAIYWNSSSGIMFACNFTDLSLGYDDFISDIKNTTIWEITLSILSEDFNVSDIVPIIIVAYDEFCSDMVDGYISDLMETALWEDTLAPLLSDIIEFAFNVSSEVDLSKSIIDGYISDFMNTTLWNDTLAPLVSDIIEFAFNVSSEVDLSNIIDGYISDFMNTTLWNDTLSLLLEYDVSELVNNIFSMLRDALCFNQTDSIIENVSIENEIKLYNLTIGKYSIDVFFDSEGIINCSAVVDLGFYEKLVNRDVALSAAYDSNANEIIVTLLDYDTGIPIMFTNVTLAFDGENYTGITNSNGQAKFLILSLNPGSYSVDVIYEGSSIHNPSSTNLDFDIISYTDIYAFYNNETCEIIAYLIDNSTGVPIPIMFENVMFSVNGWNDTVRTNMLGKARLSTEYWSPGSYSVDVIYEGGLLFDPANTTVDVVIKGNTDLSAVYADGEIVATLINEDTGQGIKGANIRFFIDGEKYSVKTNSSGQAKLTIPDLEIGVYNATVSYYGNSKYDPVDTSVEIVVTKLTTSISLYYNATTNELVATLINTETGKGISGANVVFNFNGVKTSVKTNKQGQARLSVDPDLTTFNAGVSYGGNSKYFKSTASIKIVEEKIATSISNFYDEESGEVIATLTNTATGKVITGANVVFNLNGVKVAVKTNRDGQAKFSVADLASGIYSVGSSYGGNSKYSGSTTDIIITKI